MLKGYTKTISINAVSMADVKGDVGTPVAIFRATFSKGGRIEFGESVENPAVYNEYFDEVSADNTEFRRMVKEEYNKMYGGKEGE